MERLYMFVTDGNGQLSVDWESIELLTSEEFVVSLKRVYERSKYVSSVVVDRVGDKYMEVIFVEKKLGSLKRFVFNLVDKQFFDKSIGMTDYDLYRELVLGQ